MYSLRGISSVANVHAAFPKDIVLFIHESVDGNIRYAAALESRNGKEANDLVIYKYAVSIMLLQAILALHLL